ncbi:MAG: chromosome segregation protein SMC [Candidatus Omnitrophota bacterium]
MHFKQLEIMGFKSFPHKTKLKFEPGVTAVVGPNGCGKSNISDAIRWVLGEQSAKSLRGSSMEEVIFNGTDKVDPINIAEVSLTLSNEDRALPIDYNEVTITRRLFRSGESEYILNKTPVRLKDITSLLMGTGMGTGSYSIIEQGKIGMILSTGPEERREIFEEASGITRYKAKKREAMRKLEQTESNLLRINDIITEVKRQITSIERHARKAERYKTDFEVLKDLDLKLAFRQLRDLGSDLSASGEDMVVQRKAEVEARSEHSEIATSIAKFRGDLDNIIRDLTDMQEKRSDAALIMDKSQNRAHLNNERIEDLRRLKTSLEEDLSGLKEKMRIQEEEIAKTKERFNDILKTRIEKETTLNENETTAGRLTEEIEAHQKEMKGSKIRTVDILAFETKTKNELIKIGADLQNRRSRLRRLEMERENVSRDKEETESVLAGIDVELSECKEKRDRYRAELDELKDSRNKSEALLEEKRSRAIEKENALNVLKSKEEVLKEMIENFEGFENGVKFVMEGVKSGSLSGVIGIVADLIEPEAGQELFLEAVLGQKAQAIIVESREDLLKAISYLDNKRASAHFIVYDDIKLRPGWHHNKVDMAGCGISSLASFVKANDHRTDIIDYLFDNVYFAETESEARNAGGGNSGDIKFVTRDGFILEDGYLFGRILKNEIGTSVIGRRMKLANIQRQQEEIALGIEEIRLEEFHEKARITELKEMVIVAENSLKEREIGLANVMSRREAIEANLKKINDEISVIGLEVEEVGDMIREVTQRGEELNKRLNETESEYAGIQEVITLAREAIEKKTVSRNELIFATSEIRSEISFFRNTEDHENRNLIKESKLIEELKVQYKNKVNNVEDSAKKITELEAELVELVSLIDAKKNEEMYYKGELDEIRLNKDSISRDLHEKEKIFQEKEALIEGIRDRLHSLEIKIREAELLTVNIKERVREAYKVDVENTTIEIPGDINWEETKNHIEVLRIKLDKLGPVNLVAIDEHKDLEERHSFLTQQEEDLLRAKESLHKAILKINKTTRELFMETFQKAQVEFRNYFRMLFGGGHAELLLLDESDVLECGIEIVARPPGKKLQNLLLLSGGEKALTAIALLFAIFKVKPSPFCILDEVDAPLDDSNIGRFTRILNDFLKTSQFIVITHNRKTMEMANVLYGITMEEKGVSKIVSVKFAEDEKEASTPNEGVLV